MHRAKLIAFQAELYEALIEMLDESGFVYSRTKSGKEIRSPFTTALVWAVVGKELPKEISQRAAEKLQVQIGDRGTVNYWEKGGDISSHQRLPDDLDDTLAVARALHALGQYSPVMLAQLTTALFRLEVQPGGPYRTWFIPASERRKTWYAVDPVVNAHLGLFLKLYGVHLEPVEKLVVSALQSEKLSASPFYVSDLLLVYFASGWVTDTKSLRKKLALIERKKPTSKLQQAVLALAYARIGEKKKASIFEQQLFRTRVENWETEYLVQEFDGEISGSVSLTIAIALEYISEHLQQKDQNTIEKHIRLQKNVLERAYKMCEGVTYGPVIVGCLKRIETTSASIQITAQASIAQLLFQKSGQHLKKDDLCALSLATTLGWVCYTLLDSIVDGAEGVGNNELRAALWAKKQMDQILSQYCTSPETRLLVGELIQRVHDGILWEHDHAVFELPIPKSATLPDWGEHYLAVAERSIGHCIVPLIIADLLFPKDGESARGDILHFFTHYLVARQLNDDLHDWEDDLDRGLLTPVSSLVHGLVSEGGNRRLQFWREVFPKIGEEVLYHLDQMEMLAENSRFLKMSSQMEQEIDRQRKSVQSGLDERELVLALKEHFK